MMRGRDIFQHESEEDKQLKIFMLPEPRMGVKYTVARDAVAIRKFTLDIVIEYIRRQADKGLHADPNVALYTMHYLQTWWFYSESKEYLISWLWIRMNELDGDFMPVLRAVTLDDLVMEWPVELPEDAKRLGD